MNERPNVAGEQPRTPVRVEQIVDAPPQLVWDAITDWPRQSEWILATRVRAVGGDSHEVGGRIEAFTGIGPVGFLDTMVVTEWDPPRRCVVDHTGAVVRGLGIIEVVGLPDGRSRLIWLEVLDLPAGAVGRLGWPVVRPFTVAGIRYSLRRFARLVEAEGRRDGGTSRAE